MIKAVIRMGLTKYRGTNCDLYMDNLGREDRFFLAENSVIVMELAIIIATQVRV